ncbi:MAG: glycosyltransferase [Micrococcales bacterium]|nr:glycosyltransferase [Micrococcales bacterium]
MSTTAPDAPAPATGSLAAPAPVTAVLVTHGVTGFLATSLRALAAQVRAPARVLVVDAGDRPDPALAATVRDAGLPAGSTTVLTATGARTFGDAVRAVVAAERAGAPRWLWLLHDDSAPDPSALAELVRAVEAAPSVAVAGVKQRTWTAPARLLEVGVRTSLSGRRTVDVEPGEVDQGQHDGREDVLGVGLVGALVRRDVWEDLRGTDPALGPFGDGLDLCRRARLAGHRVVVVPAAVVRHAQAGYHALRDPGTDVAQVVDLDADGEPDNADPRRSYAARRTALLHQRLVWAPLPLLPLVAVMAVLAGAVRVLVRIAGKEPVLAAAEVAAPLRALGRPAAVVRARRQARRTRRLPRRTLRPLQADARTVWRQWRDRRLTRAEARRVVRAPSELELRELAALAVRRRAVLGALAVVLVAVTAVAFGPLVTRTLGGQALVGGALVSAASGLGDVWDATTSTWVAGGLGNPGPADALLTALLPGTALAGGSLAVAVTVLLLGSVLLAGLGAWFAAGAATRSVGVRAWAAVVWAALPSLLLAAGQGRVGAVLVHVALPWLVLALARAVGVQQVDVVLPGVATAARGAEAPRPGADPGADEWPDPEAWARAGGHGAADAGDDADGHEDDGPVRVGRGQDDRPEPAERPGRDDLAGGDAPTPVRGTPTVAASGSRGPASVTAPVDGDAPGAERDARAADEDAADGGRAATEGPAAGTPDAASRVPDGDAVPPPARPSGSIAAAAAASLAFAAVAAGAPSLLLPGVLVLLVAAACSPAGRRGRVVLAAVPALVLLGPTLAAAVSRGTEGVRLLLADPGAPTASSAPSATAALLGVPADAGALVPSWLPLPDAVAAWWPAVPGGAIALLALLALLRGAPHARAVRLGWFTAAVGVGAALVAVRVVVGDDDGTAVTGWAGAGASVAAAGLLTAAVVGTRGLSARLGRATFGWRQLTAVAVAAVVVVLPLVAWGGWALDVRHGTASELRTMDRAVVPAIGRQTQQSEDAPRVLALTPSDDGRVTEWQLLRGDGPRVLDDAAATRTAGLDGPLGDPSAAEADEATAEVQAAVGRLSVGSSTDVAAQLAALAVADVLVPPLPADRSGEVAAQQARASLIGRLDSTPGLERITDGRSGVIWRVQPSADASSGTAVTAWARLVPDAGAVRDAERLTGDGAEAVPAQPGVVGRVDTRIGPGDEGRLLVLAERSDRGWRATLDGRPLRAVDDGWRQTFEVGASGGRLVVVHDAPGETAWTVAQVVVGVLALLLALPVRRRRAGRR